MNEEILNNIWNTLSNDPNASLKAQDFEEWKSSFINNKDIQSNVYDYLKQNYNVKANNLEEWTTSVMGKTNGSADATPGVEPIVTESGLDVGTLGLPETTEELNVNLLAISNGVTKNHVKVKNRLAEEYFSLDNFKQSRVKVGSGISFQGYARSEEDDLKSWFGEEKYEQYLQYKQSEVFDSKWVDDEIVKQIIGVVKQEEVEQYIGRLDIGDIKPDFKGHKDMVADARKAVQEGIFNIFDPEDASITGDGQNWLKKYIDALAVDKAKETKQKELGKTSVFFGDRATDEEIMKLRVQGSAAEKVLADYFNHKFIGYQKKSKDWKSKYNNYIEVNKTYEPQFNRISASLNALGKVDEYSSKEKIEQYNNLVAEGNSLSAGYKKALSDKNLSFEDIFNEATTIQSGLDKVVDNFDKVSDATTIAKALALDYGWLNSTSLSFESGMAEMGSWISGALKGFAYASDKVTAFGSAFADPTKLKQIIVNPQDFLSEDQNTAHMDRWRSLHAGVIDYNESVQNYKQASLPLDIDWDDVGWDNIGQWSSQALSNNAFSIATALTYSGAIRAGMNIPKATKILSGTFFMLEGGAKYTHMEIDQKNAGKYIAGLQESLKSATTKGERVQILDQIDYYEKALSATEMEKAFSSIAYGGIAMYAERLGTMRTLRNLNRISPTNNRLNIANTMKGSWQVGKGVGLEYIEEFATQVGHNLVDMTVLDQNKSLLDGIDNNFNANIIFSTLAIQGPSVGMNVFNTLRGEVATQGEILENRKRTNQIIEINGALQADQESGFKLLDAGTREFMESENRRLIREAGMKDSEMFANVANMTAAEVKEMFAINQKKRDKLKQIQNLGASSAYEKAGSNYIEKQKEKLVNDIKNLNGQRDQLRGKPGARRKEIIEATLKNDKIQVETEFYLGKAFAAKNIVKGLGNVKEFGKINEDGTIDLTDLEKYLDKKVKKGNITEGQKKEYLKGFRQGHNASFVGNDVILIESNMIRNINNAETALEKSIHAYSVIHELQHINDVKTGLVQDLDVVQSSKIAVKGIQDEVETLYKQGKIKEKDYVSFLKRVGQYTKDNNGTVDLMELLTIAGELKDAGVLSENSTDPLLSLKLMINQFSNKYFKKGEMFFKLNNTQDVLGYIDSFQRSTRTQTLVLGPEEEVKKPKFSKTQTKTINDFGKKIVDKDGTVTDLEQKGQGNYYFKVEAKNIWKQIQEQGLLDGLILAQPHEGVNNKAFLDTTYAELFSWFEKYQPERKNSSGLFGHINPQIPNRAKQAYNVITKGEIKYTKEIGETTKEGEVKIQVAAETTNEMKQLEEKDMSIQAQAQEKEDKQKVKQQKESKFRKALGIETGGVLYMKVLDAARKSLLRAYSTKDTVRQIQRNLRDQANKYLFKDIKNFLGTTKYKFNLKQYRENIMESLFVADLVQMEREVPEADRVFTKFVKKLTTKQEVEDAVNQNLLPPSAINAYIKDKSVNLYEKARPTEEQFLAYFMIPTINPVTGLRSGKKGTRKDTLAKNMAGALAYDATMEVAQEQDIIEKRQELADARGETLVEDNLEQLAISISRNIDVKFSIKSNENRIISNMAGEIISLTNEMRTNAGLVTYEDGEYKINSTVWKRWTKKAKFKKSDLAIIAEFTYKAYRSEQYSRLTDYEIATKVLKTVIKARKNKNDIKVHQAFEQMIISSLQYAVQGINSRLRTNKKVKEGVGQGDAYISYGKNILGIEVKMNEADGVSQTVNVIQNENGEYSLSYANENPTTNENGDTYDSLIGSEIQIALKELNKIFKENNLGEIKNGNQLSPKQIKYIQDDNLKTKLFKHIDVSESYAAWHYANGKYTNKPQGFIQVGKSLYRMITGNSNLDGLTNSIVHAFKGDIPVFKTEDGIKMQLQARLDTQNGVLKFRVSPRIIDNELVKSNVNLLKPTNAVEFAKAVEKVMVPFSKADNSNNIQKAVQFSRSANNPTKGITVLDFDDTLATTKSLVKFTRPDGTTGTLNAEQYASTYENLLDQGYTFDFSEFNKVVKGKLAPLFQKALKLQSKFGPKNMFVLTARPPAAQKAIFDFLKANGLNIPIDNITGLGNSTAEAKALWMAEKVGEGFNDFYFADDALQNVQAVKNMLDQLDVKSKVQQARVKFSKGMNDTFNNILEEITGIESQKRFSAIKGRKRGEDKGKFRFFIPPSHEDFVGLLYNFMGKGRRGDAHRDFLEQALVRPLNRAYRELDTAKQAIANDYKKLNEQFPDVNKKLIKNTPDGDFTFQDAIRVYLWNKHGHKIPGLTETDQAKLTKLVESDPQLQAYAETLNVISKQKDYVAPGQAWETANIRIDLVDATGRVGRAQYLSEFIENADVLFSEENLNKIEAAYGKDFREALEDMLHRIKTGVNRPKGQSGKPNKFLNWLNASVAGVMFFNTRSALLQQLSNVNYLNFADNNIFKAGLAFANQKQYWADFAFILNSDMLKQRRGGIGTDVNGAELVEAIKKARPDSMFDQVAIITGKLLRLGFLPTQMGDSIAIATGGAAFYRNRINTYLKQGLSQKEAEAKAFTDFQNITQSTQQSARPDMTSQQQAMWIGKLVLNFLNTPSQYNRIIKKAGSDLKNRRITKPNTSQVQSDMSNLSRILYYGAAQNLIFYGLQTALFAVMFGDDDDENEAFLKKKERVINGSIDTILRGSGIYGVALSTIKNMMIKFAEQREKGYNKDESAVIMEALNFSPVLGIRARKIVNAEKTLNYNTKVIDEMTTFDIDNPQWSAVTNYVEGTTTLPVNRLYQKTINVRNALDNQYTAFQRAMFFSGYTTWSLDLGDTEKMKKIKENIKAKAKRKKKSKRKSKRGRR